MRATRIARLFRIPMLASVAALAAGCAALTTPSACRPLCEVRESDTCQQCLADERARREEARRQREAESALGAPHNIPPSGGSGGAPSGY